MTGARTQKSPLAYERLAHGEVDLPLTDQDRSRLDQMAREDQEFLERHPAGALKPVRRPAPLAAFWMTGGGLAAAALLVVVGWATVRPVPEPDTRVKSASLTLLVYHETEKGSELLGPSSRLAKDDRIQIAYFSAQQQYAAIFSVDGRGTVTTHLPLNSPQALEVRTAKPELLPYAYTLDDAPDFETVYLVASAEPFAVAKIRPFLKALVTEKEAQLTLPAGFTYTAFRIAKKETSPEKETSR